MNFFEHQDRARRKTKQLVALLCLAVIALVVITTLAFATLIYWSGNGSPEAYQPQYGYWQGVAHSLSLNHFFWIALSVSGVVLLGSLFRFIQLGSGGRAIAESMGGRLLLGDTGDLNERKILNVVEEMAIASGTPVPPVYLIEDDAINAFAAGYHPQDAIIGITRGCINQLNRAELQGVIAHEFSHIFHGDMRLNMRLVALLYGILVIGLIGHFLLRGSQTNRLLRSNRGKSTSATLVIGLGLMVIGYTGTFFGNLIKAAVSRQREFLADASAVQFTRNPDGIAGALKKIGSSSQGSALHNDQAAEFSHMYFSQGVNLFLTMMATHPPLNERIKRIQPSWNGKYSEPITSATQDDLSHPSMSQFAGQASQGSAIDVDAALEQIAQPSQAQLTYAQGCLKELSAELKAASQNPFSARALVFGLLLDKHADQRQGQYALLTEHLTKAELTSLGPLIQASANSPAHLRLPLIELCINALKQLSTAQRSDFFNCLAVLMNADSKISLMEWAIYRILVHNLQPKSHSERLRPLEDAHNDCQLLLSLVAYSGARSQATAESAFNQARSLLPLKNLTLLPASAVKLNQVDAALDRLNHIKPLQKPQLLKAISLCVMHDQQLLVSEAELFRALADSLDCPIPPQLQAQPIRI